MNEAQRTRYMDPETGRPDPGRFIRAVAEDARGWFSAQRELTTIAAGEKAGRLAGMTVLFLVLFFFCASTLLMAGVSLALWLGELLASTSLGFLAAGGVYLVLAALFWVIWRLGLRDKVILAIINAIHGND